MKHLFLKFSLSLICITFLSACASEEEKIERRENSYDLSGEYKVSSNKGSEIDFNLTILNESGRHDIVAYVERLSPMTEKEISMLKTQGLDPVKVSNHFKNVLVLGKGKNKGNLDGGENISTDFGESSQFYVCTPRYQYNPEYELSYCLSGTATKSTKLVKGSLTFNWSRQRNIKIDGVETKEVTVGRTDLGYQSDLSVVFYKQYLGNWSGTTFLLVSDFNHQLFQKITLREVAGNSFEALTPLATSFVFRGEIFSYDLRTNQSSLDILKKPDYPAIQILFTGNRGNRVALIGQIWSLGDFTGSITLITPQSQLDLATFQLKKD